MTFIGNVVLRVFKFSLQKININRTHRISSLLLSNNLCNLHACSNKYYHNNVWKRTPQIKKGTHNVFNQVRAMGALSPMDPSSYSRPELTLMKHVSMSLSVDFENKILCGEATLKLDVLDNVSEVILDSSKLNIESVKNEDDKSLKFHIGEDIPNYGSKLTITLDQGLRFGNKWFKGKCKKYITVPTADDDIKLNYNGFVYEPDIFEISGKGRNEPDKHRCDLGGQRCVYYNKVDNIGQLPNSELRHVNPNKILNNNLISIFVKNMNLDFLRKLYKRVITIMRGQTSVRSLECMSEENLERQENFARRSVVAQREEYYILGPHGSRYRVATKEELKRLAYECAKQLALIESDGGIPTQTSSHLAKLPSIYVTSVLDDDGAVLPRCRYLDFCPERIKNVTLKIKYSTSPEASALQWLEPNQTTGKILPFMFSQCQPIHARSILPCQDTPAVKFTYDAEITAASEFTVVMSALRGDVKGNTTYFRQPMPLPSYLVAIAVGELDSKYLGPRSRVWSEKGNIDKSAWEFSDTEHYLQAAEKLCGPYQWTEYDLLVLPPSFPYGGMENPCLTFVTPTLLAGDKSLADVIVHEIMHSWTGNLVTNRNFEHFWLNEGFTVYLERKVTASLNKDPVAAKKTRDFHSILGLQELSEAVQHLGAENQLTRLVVDLDGTHPDDAFSTVPYEKGSLFLRYLEELLGGAEVFDDFIRSYLQNFSKKSLDTTDFKAYLYKYFKGDMRLEKVDWDTWLNKPGMPPVIPEYDTSITKSVDSLLDRIYSNNTFSISDVQFFAPQQLIYLLQKLVDGEPLSPEALRAMEEEYKLNDNRNAEIRYRLVRMCIKSKDKKRLDEVFEFVNSQGRMKYVRPIYRDLYAWDFAREQAISNFLKNEKYMMHVSAYTIRKDLHLND